MVVVVVVVDHHSLCLQLLCYTIQTGRVEYFIYEITNYKLVNQSVHHLE